MLYLTLTLIVMVTISMPISFAIGVAGAVYFMSSGMIPFPVTIQRVVAQTQSTAFLAVPFFIFAGHLMNRTGITDRLLRFSSLLTRKMHGGLAQLNVVLSTMMGGISGSAVADSSMEARVLGPAMIQRGYPRGYTAAITCLSSLITATIPPSLGLILYGFVGEVSIGRLFVAGLIPGILMMIALMLTVRITAKRRGFEPVDPNAKSVTWNEFYTELKDSIWALIFPLILILGIRFGLFTPSEAGAFAVVYALLIGAFVYKELTWKKFKEALWEAVIDNGSIIIIIALSGIFGYALSLENVTGSIGAMLTSLTTNPQIMLLIVVAFLFVAGMLVDSNVIVLLLTPILLPIVTKVGVDPVHFGIVMMTIVTMGVMTPPIGTAVYIVCGILETPLNEFIRESLPFFAAVLALVVVLIFIPDLVTFLPNLVYDK